MSNKDDEQIREAKELICRLRELWPKKTDRPNNKEIDLVVAQIVSKLRDYGYPRFAKDIQTICTPAHYNILIDPDDEKSEYWIGVLKGLRYVDVAPPDDMRRQRLVDEGKLDPDELLDSKKYKQNPFQFLNWSGNQEAYRWRIKIFRRDIKQKCDECGHISSYFYPRIGKNNPPNYLKDENGIRVKNERGYPIPQNKRYVELNIAWKIAEVKNICPKCWDSGRGKLVSCPNTWMQQLHFSREEETDRFEELTIPVYPRVEDDIIFQDIIDKFIADKWVKLGSREHELLTTMFNCPDPNIKKYYSPADNDPPMPATTIVNDEQYGAIVLVCLLCDEECKNGIVGYGKCRNYQLKLAEYYGTSQTCINQYRKRLVAKLTKFFDVHEIDIIPKELISD